MTLDDELDRIFAGRDRNNMQPTIDALLPLYASHPENARVLYEVGGAYDTAGQEDIAQGFYKSTPAHFPGRLPGGPGKQNDSHGLQRSA